MIGSKAQKEKKIEAEKECKFLKEFNTRQLGRIGSEFLFKKLNWLEFVIKFSTDDKRTRLKR